MSQKVYNRMMTDLTSLKYPIGKFNYTSEADKQLFLDRLEALPEQLKELVKDLSKEELNWRYRPEGWKLFQVIHHIGDSHINAYTRMKVASTESGKSITPYDENAWVTLSDAQDSNINDALEIISLIHKKLVTFLSLLYEDQWNGTYYHPEDKVQVSLKEAVQIYAWHGEHHLAHIKQGLASKGVY